MHFVKPTDNSGSVNLFSIGTKTVKYVHFYMINKRNYTTKL